MRAWDRVHEGQFMASGRSQVFTAEPGFVRYGRIAANATIPSSSAFGYKRRIGASQTTSAY